MIFFKWHAGLMAAGLISFLSALLIAVTQRQKLWWLRFHRAAGMVGTILVLSGMAAAIAAVAAEAKGHLRTPHTWLGALTIAVAMTTPIFGFLQFKIPGRMKIRAAHRICGRLLTGAALVTILFGLRVAGLL